jgi:hypothetical protein
MRISIYDCDPVIVIGIIGGWIAFTLLLCAVATYLLLH